MAQSLEEQIVTVERALGERMIESALVIIRAWINELGENNPYEEAHASIRKRYDEQFSLWLTSDDEQIDAQLNTLTGDAYQLADAVYADLRLKRGISPDMHGFNPDSTASVLRYFSHCVRLRPEDIEWLHEMMRDEDRVNMAMIALPSLAMNLRECFSMDSMLVLIEGMTVENELVSNHCIAAVLKLLIQYDIRIDFFRPIQDAFIEALQTMEGGAERVVAVLGALCLFPKHEVKNEQLKEASTIADLTKLLEDMIKAAQSQEGMSAVVQWFPSSEIEFLEGLMHILPDTWVYNVLTEGNPGAEQYLAQTLLENGFRNVLWSHPDLAEKVYRAKLRKKGEKNAQDYINYAHCLLLRGDRMMAFENYRQARVLCKNVKEFYGLFRPDRSELADHGIPLEQVYLIEDQLFQV